MSFRSSTCLRWQPVLLAPLIAVLGCGRLEYAVQNARDSGGLDAGLADADLADAGLADAGLNVDAASLDAASLDGGLVDSGIVDAGLDASVADGGPLGTFAPPTPLAGLAAMTGADDPSLTADRLELYLNLGNDLLVARRASTGDAWGSAAPVAELNTTRLESSPEVSSDGLTLYFSRDDGSGSSLDLWVSTRATRSDPWGTPVRIAELSTTALDTNPAVSGDALRIVFSRGSSGTSRDLFEATRVGPTGAFDTPARLAELATSANEGGPMLAAGGTVIVFFSNRPGSTGNDLYVATRSSTSSPFGAPTRIAEVSTTGDDSDPWISEDGRHLVFARDGVLVETSR